MTAPPDNERPRTSLWGWVALLITVGSYFVLMYEVASAPGKLARPLGDGTLMSVGLFGGVLVIIICIITSVLFTVIRNVRERGQ